MKKLFLIFLFPFFIFAQSNLNEIIDTIITINKNTQTQTSAKVLLRYSNEKLALMNEMIALITKGELQQNLSLDNTIKTLQLSLDNTRQIQSPYSLALNTLELNTLIAKKILHELLVSLHEKNDIFTTHVQMRGKLNQSIHALKELTNIPSANLTANQQKEFQTKFADFKITLESYIEILSYLQLNLKLLLPNSFWTSFDLQFIFDKILSILPSPLKHLIFAKFLLSFVIFALLFIFRNLITHTLLKAISYLSRFLQNKEIQEQIKTRISAPIFWLIIIISIHLSLDILTYPNHASHALVMWVNTAYIIDLSFLTILLFKGYGTAILSNLAEKNNSFRREVINLLLKVMYFLIIVIAILVMLKNFGFNISALIASLGIGGLAVAFAIKDMLANFFASVVLLFDNSFNQGDWIVCGEIEGTVVEIGLRRTTIRTFDNAMLFVPNALLANGSVRNWNRRKIGRRIRFDVGLTYDSTPDQIRACIKDIKEMLLKHPKIAKENDTRPPLSHYELDLKRNIVSLDDLLGYKSNLFVVLEEFANSSINILIYCFSTTTVWGEWLDVRQDVMLKIMEILDKHNLSFAFPSQSLYIEKLPKSPLDQIFYTSKNNTPQNS